MAMFCFVWKHLGDSPNCCLTFYLSSVIFICLICAFSSFANIQSLAPAMLTSLQVVQYSRQCGLGSLVLANLTRLISSSSFPQGQGSMGFMRTRYSVLSCAVLRNSQRSNISFGMRSLIQILKAFA